MRSAGFERRLGVKVGKEPGFVEGKGFEFGRKSIDHVGNKKV